MENCHHRRSNDGSDDQHRLNSRQRLEIDQISQKVHCRQIPPVVFRLRGCCAFPWDPGARVCGCTPKAFWSVRSGGAGLCRPLRGQRGVGLDGFAKGVFGGGGFLGGRHRAIRTRRAWLPSEKSIVFPRRSPSAILVTLTITPSCVRNSPDRRGGQNSESLC